MENCKCCRATTSATDDAGRCTECHLIAERCRARIANGELRHPELSAPIEGAQPIPIDPIPAPAGTLCDGCGQQMLGNQSYRSGDRTFFVHEKCWEVLLTL